MNTNQPDVRLVGIILACSFAAYYFEQILILLVIIIAILMWHYYQIYAIHRLLYQSDKKPLILFYGLFAEIYLRINQYYLYWKHYRHSRRRIYSRFQQSFKYFPNPVLLLDKQWQVKWYNPISKKILANETQYHGQSLLTLIPHPVLTEYLREKNFSKPVVIELPHKQQIIIELQFVSLINDETLLIISDITDKTNLSRSQKDFITNVSHELKTPLTVLMGFAEPMLSEIGQFDPQWQYAIKTIHQQTQKMQQLIDELLVLSRLESQDAVEKIELQSIDMKLLIEQAVDDAKLIAANTGHQIEVDIDEQLTLHANPVLIRLLVDNLLRNAIKHTPESCHIWIYWDKCGSALCFIVKDNGEGIAPRHLSRLTERFYRVDSSRNRNNGGTGLGLSIVKHALKHCNGEFEIQSEVGRGSEFICRFNLLDN
ncbi:MAG: phosphate regulon sensor histidine kinase PhoR [Gammaproteobacteria bacterium]|nr:phosphate regulon sensor histidine kinase PhoR [Gammaproteobacteria bacterium]